MFGPSNAQRGLNILNNIMCHTDTQMTIFRIQNVIKITRIHQIIVLTFTMIFSVFSGLQALSESCVQSELGDNKQVV